MNITLKHVLDQYCINSMMITSFGFRFGCKQMVSWSQMLSDSQCKKVERFHFMSFLQKVQLRLRLSSDLDNWVAGVAPSCANIYIFC